MRILGPTRWWKSSWLRWRDFRRESLEFGFRTNDANTTRRQTHWRFKWSRRRWASKIFRRVVFYLVISPGDETNWLRSNAWRTARCHQPGEKRWVANQLARLRGDVVPATVENDFWSRDACRLEKQRNASDALASISRHRESSKELIKDLFLSRLINLYELHTHFAWLHNFFLSFFPCFWFGFLSFPFSAPHMTLLLIACMALTSSRRSAHGRKHFTIDQKLFYFSRTSTCCWILFLVQLVKLAEKREKCSIKIWKLMWKS